ncbi:MAG: response regulator [Gemmataceae bacterium]
MAAREGKIPNPAPSDSGPFYNPGDLRLLVVDDDPAIGRLIKAAFAPQGFNVDIVSEPAHVEARIKGEPYQVILLDYVLPGLDSSEVMRWVRDHQPDASVIVVTGFPTMDSALHCLREHTYDYITKPFEIDHLKKVVLRCLESRGLLRLSEEALREQLGAAIRERRKTLGLTLAEMAKRSNVSLGYLSQIELGKNSASVETLYRIALGLRMRVADLFQSIQSLS